MLRVHGITEDDSGGWTVKGHNLVVVQWMNHWNMFKLRSRFNVASAAASAVATDAVYPVSSYTS